MLVDAVVACHAHVMFGNLGLYVLVARLIAFLVGLNGCGEWLKLFGGMPDSQETAELGFVDL